MPRRPRSLRYRLLALALEVLGMVTILAAVASISLVVAIVLAGVTVIVAAQFVERAL